MMRRFRPLNIIKLTGCITATPVPLNKFSIFNKYIYKGFHPYQTQPPYIRDWVLLNSKTNDSLNYHLVFLVS